MNKLTIIGNLARDPEQRMTSNGMSVCNFTVAVNRRKRVDGQPEADFFRVSAWQKLGDNCQRFLAKGRKVAVVGPVSVSTYQANDGSTRAQLEIIADDVEFLSSRGEENGVYPAAPDNQAAPARKPNSAPNMAGFEEVTDDELPF
jgi:single-strand DNA-binding protein